MTAEAAGPGILYVNSKIISPTLSTELFTKWYEDIHIPDIFATSGIKSAFRYYTSANDQNDVERPYLALYPLKDVGFLQTPEFKSIPVHSDILPVDSKMIFDLADFDTRYYLHVAKVEAQDAIEGPYPFIAAVQFYLPSDLSQADNEKIQSWYLSNRSTDAAKRTRIYRLYFARQNRLPQDQNKIAQPPEFLALHEFESLAGLQKFLSSAPVGEHVAQFKMLKAFGDVKHVA